ncbi:hypothetical protein EJ08DRAFT_679449 [Tothia fuscella]|uniref:Uncharacterized protein n=1 Tax=Tothia fuscella TaxID=1048955 RepID=A0A9P4NRN5_9PEZI|nr:hypothetical protein EJ08DRAFT_679449 [Tothia fuscella]
MTDNSQHEAYEAQPFKFEMFTSLRYDPILLKSLENQDLSFTKDCALYMPVYHRNRILEAARYFNFTKAIPLLKDGVEFQTKIMQFIEAYEQNQRENEKPLRVKVIVNREGELDVEINSVPEVELSTLYPNTLTLPSKEPEEPLEVSPLTGGALNMGPTDYQPVPNHNTSPQKHTIYLDSATTTQSAHTSLKTTHRPHYDASRTRHVKTMPEEVLLQNPKGEITEGSLTTPYFFRNGIWVTPPVHDGHGGQRGTTRRWAIEKGLCSREEVVRRESVVDGERVWVSNGVRGFGWGVVVKGR